MALITFDLDGVLQRNPFRTGVFPHIWRVLAPAYARRAPETPPDEAARGVADLIRAEFLRRQVAGDWVGAYDWDDICNSVARRLGHAGEPFDVAALVRRYCTPEHIHAYPGAHACLTALQAAGHTLKVLTNGFAGYQEPVLAALELRGFFAAVLTPDRCRTAKPFPEFFRRAGVPPALHVGDTLVHDVYGTRLAGFASIWLPPDLPAELHPLSPRERAEHPALPAFMARRLEVEAAWHPAPRPALAECRPDYVVLSLSEVPAAVADWSATVT